ncbi:universal stress protein [Actinacidiphila glaucinigra]|uniref:universal stress protein n=1 Tax=Actinacidiphila glaucinigra TaxID=235986 RepID=UPI002DD9F258|nr:universal stress protein [Actinacidiphila glaucinigra]WSD64653.1 universal stress protein [Actinacidiphila glaucinigra]
MSDTAYGAGTPHAPHGEVVVGVDGSDPAVRALDQAAEEARRRDSVLRIVLALPWPDPGSVGFGLDTDRDRPPGEAARVILESAARRVADRHPGLTVALEQTAEPAAAALVRLGRTAALTVVGTRGRGGFAGLLLGSVGLRVAAHTAGPLMVVRGEDAAARRGLLHDKVLLGLEDESDAEAALFAFEEAERRGARLRVLHTWTHPHVPLGEWPASHRHDVAVQARQHKELARFAVSKPAERFPGVAVRVDTAAGHAAAALVEASRAADVVVVGAHRREGRPLGMRLGPVTHAVLHHAHCPVVMVPIV